MCVGGGRGGGGRRVPKGGEGRQEILREGRDSSYQGGGRRYGGGVGGVYRIPSLVRQLAGAVRLPTLYLPSQRDFLTHLIPIFFLKLQISYLFLQYFETWDYMTAPFAVKDHLFCNSCWWSGGWTKGILGYGRKALGKTNSRTIYSLQKITGCKGTVSRN